MKWRDVSQYDKGYPSNEPREDVEALRKFIDGHQIVVDEPDGGFRYEPAPSARPAREALDALLARLEQTELEAHNFTVLLRQTERERDEAMEGQREQLQERLHYERRAEALEREREDSRKRNSILWQELNGHHADALRAEARAEAAERALRQIADADPYDADSYALTWVARTALGEKK